MNLLAAALIGIASVIDGDTLEIHGERVRLEGIDAPESRQVCTRDGQPWMCGKDAALALSDFIGRRTVECEPKGKDRYKRTLAYCSVGGVEINGWLVENGWALDYRQYSKGRHAELQRQAEEARRGVWGSEFVAPWEWRRKARR